MKRARLIRKNIILCLALALCAAWAALPAMAITEGAQVAIPVSATGADCTAELRDAAGDVIQTLPLKAGEEKAFFVECDRLQRYNYSVRLSDADTDEVTYDRTVYNVHIDLYYEYDMVTAAITAQPEGASGEDGKVDELAFANTVIEEVAPGSYTPRVIKRVEGNPATAERFTFVLSSASNTAGLDFNPMPGGAQARQVTAQVQGAGEAAFGAIAFDAPGDYVYQVYEQRTDAKGYEYDESVYTLTVTVAANAAGNALECAARITLDGAEAESLTFTNAFTANPGLKLEKTVLGTPAGGTAYALDESIRYRLTVTNTGDVGLTDVEVSDPLTGLTRTIASLAAGQSASIDTSYVVKAEDMTAGTVVNTATVKAENPVDPTKPLTDEGKVTSPVVKPATFDPPVRKAISGSPSAKASFTFALSAESNTVNLSLDDMPMPAGSSGHRKTVSISGAGEKEFGQMTFTRAGTYVYQVVEANTGAANYTYDTAHYTMTVVVTQSGDSLKAAVTYAKGGASAKEIVFTNTYTPPSGGTTTTTEGEPEPETTPEPTTTVVGRKVWVDEGNAHRTRPGSITVRLYANGAPVNLSPTWSDTSGNTWTFAFNDLPVYDAVGSTIQYTVDEAPVANYESSVSGTTITNRLLPSDPRGYTRIAGEKIWNDNNNADGARPAAVTIRLRRNGETVNRVTISAADNWQYSFENLPTDDGYGNTYIYSVREDVVEGYFPRIEGNDIINTRRKPDDIAGNAFGSYTQEELEEMIELFNYDIPLWGSLLKTGDETPIYPFVAGGIGLAAVAVLLVFGRKRRKR